MAQGPGRYDDLCTLVRERAEAAGAIVVVFRGNKGDGFSMQAPMEITLATADILEYMAKEIRITLETERIEKQERENADRNRTNAGTL